MEMKLNVFVQSLVLSSLCGHVTLTRSLTVRAPIIRQSVPVLPATIDVGYAGKLSQPFDQKAFAGESPESHHEILNVWSNLIHIIECAVGTPPQKFKAMLRISQSDQYVPSVNCSTYGCDGHPRYNSSQSSTYVANGTEIDLDTNVLQISGVVSQDTWRIGDLEVEDQLFTEGLEAAVRPGYWRFAFDAILGLAPTDFAAVQRIPNAFSSMVSQKLLDRNLFSMRLATEDEPGEIIFGGVDDDLYTGELVHLPLTNETGRLVSGTWQVEAGSFSYGEDRHGASIDLRGYTAVFDTAFPFISLPGPIAERVMDLMGAEPIPFYLMSIPCERRDFIPDVTFNLAGHNFTMSPFEYTLPVMVAGYGLRCLSTFFPLGDVMKPDEPTEPPFIILGSAFLRGFYSVFDLDSGTVGLAKPRY
ncbi:MAG: hypothetical protein M4579_000658 [Chaenotheca gracillima]|nr:MAG: hypothetical protein M4579_000658 [Chaenotheca gracillima]